MEMRLKIGEREAALGYKGGFRFETTAEGLGVREQDARFTGPVFVEGTLENTGGSFRVTGEIRARRSFVCDRCLAEAESSESYSFAEEFRKGEETDDGAFFGADGIALAPLARDAILCSLPIRNLCRPDCKGLCPKCGADLNQGDCGCDREVTDPRLAVLKDWMKNNSDGI